MEPLAPKRPKKALFSSRLAGVNAQTPQHAKMKIIANIIRRICNRYNIDPEDLFDDYDSNAQSKSSSRAPAEGDENVDWLALDTTKRCNNGHALLKTFKGRVETKEIKEYLLRHKYGYFINKEKEKNLGLRTSRFGGTYEHIRCRDYRKPSSFEDGFPIFCPCSIKIARTKNDGGSDETMLYMMDDHSHDRMAIPKVGLDDGMKKRVEKHYKNG